MGDFFSLNKDALPPSFVLNGHYCLEEVVGHGGFGITYAAKDTSLQIRVAVKELYLRKICRRRPDGSVAAPEEYQEQFRFFPTHKAAFNRKLSEAMVYDYVLDAKGNITRDKAGEPVIRSIDTVYLSNYAQVNIYPLTEEKAARLVDLVSSTTKLELDNADICEIVKNSVRGYYTGSLSLSDASAAAQAAVTDYLSF